MTGSRLGRAVGAAVLAVGALAGCASGKASLGCGKSALMLTGDLQDLSDRVTNVGILVDPVRRAAASDALTKLQHDADGMAADSSDPARRRAARTISRQADAVRVSLDAGHVPHLTPLADAVGAWAKTCGAGG